jgi:hypothetical protein
MSKPDPSITANLLSSLPKTAEAHAEKLPKSARKVEQETKGPSPKLFTSTKPTAKVGTGQMRSSNRGK